MLLLLLLLAGLCSSTRRYMVYIQLVVVLEGEYHPNPHFLYFYVVVYTDTLCGRIPNKCLLLKIVCEII